VLDIVGPFLRLPTPHGGQRVAEPRRDLKAEWQIFGADRRGGSIFPIRHKVD